ncbi:hypothetical protein C8Q73DRAFT_817702 [Cubamyces lactineus]|nr:hypothetical protein C8Q73DRAFT_817702 [Cubamyces lactineus]
MSSRVSGDLALVGDQEIVTLSSKPQQPSHWKAQMIQMLRTDKSHCVKLLRLLMTTRIVCSARPMWVFNANLHLLAASSSMSGRTITHLDPRPHNGLHILSQQRVETTVYSLITHLIRPSNCLGVVRTTRRTGLPPRPIRPLPQPQAPSTYAGNRIQNDPNSAPTTLEGRVPLRTGADTLPTGSLVSKRTRACSEDSDGEEAGQPRHAAKTKRTRARSGDFGGEEPGRPQRAAKTKRVRHTRTVPNQDLPDRNPLFIPSPTPLVTVDTCETPDATVQPDPNPFRSVPDDSGDEQGILVQVPESSNGHTAATDLASAERPCELMPVDSADENGGELQNDGELGQESMDSHQFVRLRSLSYVSMVYDVDGDASAMDAEATSPTSLNLHDQPLSVVNGNNLPMVPGNELPQHDWPHNQVLIQEEETPVRVLRDEAVPQLMRRIEDDLEPPTSPNGSGFPSSSEKTAALLCDNDAPADDLGATLVDAASDSVHPPLAGTDSTREHSNPLRLDAELSHIRSRLDWLSQGDSASEVPPIPPIPDPQHNLTPSEVGVIDAACQNGSLLPAASDTGRGRPSVVIHVHAQGGSRVVLELL